MKNLNKIFFLSLLILCVSCKVDFDKLERRDGLFYYNGRLFSGTFFQNYNSGNIRSEGKYYKGMINGNFILYYENGQVKEDLNYEGFRGKQGQLHGVQKKFDDNGRLVSIENYVYGNKQGLSQHFDKVGRQLSSYLYKYDTLHGEFFYFSRYTEDPDSEDVKIVGKYNMGKLDGEYIVYDTKFVKLKMIMYDNGNIKFEENYDKNGKVIK